MSVCACPPDQSGLCDDCTGLVEHLDHQAVRRCAYPPCSKPLVRRTGERPWYFRQRTCCDASCSNRKASGSTAPLDLPDRKACGECGATTYRRVGESPNRWAAREFCSRQCSSRNTIRKNSARRSIPAAAEVKACAGCRGEFRRRPGEEANKWRDRKFCSWGCRYGRSPGPRTPPARETKPCLGCGGAVVRPAGCSASVWAARKYCSRGCASAAARPLRTEPSVPRTRKPTPDPVPVPAPIVRPSVEQLVTDPAVAEMDRKRRVADTLLDQGVSAGRVAVELGVSVALVNRWDRGDR